MPEAVLYDSTRPSLHHPELPEAMNALNAAVRQA
jgi:hypothetical protein